MARRTSLKDIAEKLGVSTALVSYVLNGKEKEKRVGAELARKIRLTAIELNYKPNQIAQSLRKGKTKTIGLIVADIANPFFGNLARVIEDEANKSGYTVIIGSSDEDVQKSARLINIFQNRQVDGFIIVPAENTSPQIKSLIQGNTPVVLIDRSFEDLQANHVLLDNYESGRTATSQFIRKGYQHIAMVAYESTLNHMKERIRGYMDVMKEMGFENNIHVKYVRFSTFKSDTEINIGELFDEKPKTDALFFATNELTVRGLYSIKRLNIKVPESLSLIGFDGSAAFDLFYSPLTYVKQPIEEMGQQAVGLLLDQIDGSKKVVKIELKHHLILRESCS